MTAPVILIHGAFCGSWAMAPFKHAFEAAGYSALAPDLRHHEAGAKIRDLAALGVTGMRDYASDIRRLIIGLDEKPILVGHSMGGLIAQMLAGRDLARALILLAPSAPWGVLPSHWNEVASAFGLYFVNGNYWDRALVPTYEIAAQAALAHVPERDRHDIFAHMVPESGRAVFETLHWWLDLKRAIEVPADSVKCPVFCAAGSVDAVSPPEMVRRIAARYRERATSRIYHGMSHWLVGEPGWERIAQEALAWLAGLPPEIRA